MNTVLSRKRDRLLQRMCIGELDRYAIVAYPLTIENRGDEQMTRQAKTKDGQMVEVLHYQSAGLERKKEEPKQQEPKTGE